MKNNQGLKYRLQSHRQLQHEQDESRAGQLGENGGTCWKDRTEMRRRIMEQLRSVKMAERGKGKRNSRTMSAQGTRAVRSTAQ